MPELLVILVIALLVFGAGRLPEVGSSLGKAIRGFKESSEKREPEPPGKSDDVTGGRTCPQCGKAMPAESAFCPSCGKKTS
jgi:sec-independent protein translocase protein TatA